MTRLSRLVRAVPYALPLRRRFRGIDVREGVLVAGPAGWGEFAPFADYDDERDARWLAAAVAACCDPLPAPVRDTVPVNAILPALPPAEIPAAVAAAVTDLGCTTVKLKVADGDPATDLERVRAVRAELDRLLGDDAGAIRLDANGRWAVEQAAQIMRQLHGYGVEYVEQPCATVAELRALRARRPGIAVAVDETVRRDRMLAAIDSVADVAVLKVSPLGGPTEVLALADSLGVPVVLSGALESSIGLARDVATAAALPQLRYACGLGTGVLLADDVVRTPLLPSGGVLRPGPLPQPDAAALQRATARLSATRQQTWLDRLDRAWRTACAHGLVPSRAITMLGAA